MSAMTLNSVCLSTPAEVEKAETGRKNSSQEEFEDCVSLFQYPCHEGLAFHFLVSVGINLQWQPVTEATL